MITSFIHTVGRRRAVLFLIGGVWILMGLSIMLSEPSPPVSGLPHTYLPSGVRFFLWAASGVVAIFAAVHSTRGSRAESIGFAALYVMPAERALSYFIAWVSALDVIPGVGMGRGWIFCLQYLAYVGLIYICAGWFEERKVAE